MRSDYLKGWIQILTKRQCVFYHNCCRVLCVCVFKIERWRDV